MTEVVVKIDGSDLTPSSNPSTIDNVIPGVGGPDKTWSPKSRDENPSVKIKLPEVNGVPAGDYPIMKVELTPVGELGPVTVTIVGKNGSVVFEVSIANICKESLSFCLHIILSTCLK